jgi:hypothetical protein
MIMSNSNKQQQAVNKKSLDDPMDLVLFESFFFLVFFFFRSFPLSMIRPPFFGNLH